METMTMQVTMVPTRLLVPSPTNPRKKFDDASMAELVTSVAQHGLMTPPLVRPWPEGRALPEGTPARGPGEVFYEIVAGERRCRAAKGADLEEVPCFIRDLDDNRTLEMQLVENLQRNDLEPTEEAEGFDAMMGLRDADGQPLWTVERLAERVGKSVRFVYQRLKLLKAPASARKALADGRLTVSHLELIGQVPSAELREAFTQRVLKPNRWNEGVATIAAAREILREEFIVDLKGASWPMDATLGQPWPCTTCPHRSGNVPDMADELSQGGSGGGRSKGASPNLCLLPTCFKAKQDARWEEARAAAEREGKQVLSDKEAEKHLWGDGSLKYDSEFVLANGKPTDSDLAGKPKKVPTWRKVATSGETTAPIVVARTETGKVVELVKRKLVIEAAKANGSELFASGAGRAKSEARADEAARLRKDKEKLLVMRRAHELFMEDATAAVVDVKLWPKALHQTVVWLAWGARNDEAATICRRLGIEENSSRYGRGWAGALKGYAVEADEAAQKALLVELAFTQVMSMYCSAWDEKAKALAELASVDLKHCEARAKVERATLPKRAPKPWAMPKEATEKIFFAWLAKARQEDAATPTSRAKARGDGEVRAQFVLWMAQQKAMAPSRRAGGSGAKAPAKAPAAKTAPLTKEQRQEVVAAAKARWKRDEAKAAPVEDKAEAKAGTAPVPEDAALRKVRESLDTAPRDSQEWRDALELAPTSLLREVIGQLHPVEERRRTALEEELVRRGLEAPEFEWNEHGVCLNPHVIPVELSPALRKKWTLTARVACTAEGWGFGCDVSRTGSPTSTGCHGQSCAVSAAECSWSNREALRRVADMIGTWLREVDAPGAVTLAVKETFDRLLGRAE